MKALRSLLRTSACALATLSALPLLQAETLTRELLLDFTTLLRSRDLNGFAVRDDGRLLAGPQLNELTGSLPGTPWTIAHFPSPSTSARWLVGTGPNARVLEILVQGDSFTTAKETDLGLGHVHAVAAVDANSFLAVSSPGATLFLVREGRIVSRLPLGAEAAWRILRREDGGFLIGTGNPARVLAVDVAKFSEAGVRESLPQSDEALAAAGITVVGEIRDRHIRSLLVRADGTILAGSAPRGLVYLIAGETGEPPRILAESRDSEVNALLETKGGRVLALVTSGRGAPETGSGSSVGSPGGAEVSRPGSDGSRREPPSFSGQVRLFDITPGSFPEAVLTQQGAAGYGMAELEGLIYIAAGERGEMLAWNPETRRSFTLAGTSSAQNVALTEADGNLLVLRANLAGLSRLVLNPDAPRSITTSAIDLGGPTRLGRLVFSRIAPGPTAAPAVSFQVSLGADETEFWGGWREARAREGGGYDLFGMQARRVRLKLSWEAGLAPGAEISQGRIYHLPRNQPPRLEGFRILPQNFGIVRNPDPPTPPFMPLMQFLQRGDNTPPSGQGGAQGNPGQPQRQGFLGSPVIRMPGAQVVVWNVTDPNGDDLIHTLSIRGALEDSWRDILVGTRENYAQFDVSNFPDGSYTLRLVSRELFPHPDGVLELVYEDDSLVIDNKAPEFVSLTTTTGEGIRTVTVHGRDATSRLGYVHFVFNNGRTEQVFNPVDGILDSQEEIFRLSLPEAHVSDASTVEVFLYDAKDNVAIRTIPLR
jgi:hypothetical protein